MKPPERWDLETDVVVLGAGAGAGAGAATAAIVASDGGAEVALLERAETVGGTSALSGGVLWIPNNHHMAEAGIPDSREDVLAYLDSLSLGVMDPELVATFIDTGPEMVRYLATSPASTRQRSPCANNGRRPPRLSCTLPSLHTKGDSHDPDVRY